jgi:hypothetical protein
MRIRQTTDDYNRQSACSEKISKIGAMPSFVDYAESTTSSFVMMGSGVRISLAAPIQVLSVKLPARVSKLFATTSFSVSRRSTGDRVETGEVWCRAVQSDHPDVSALVVT